MRFRMPELDSAFSFSATPNLSLLSSWSQWTAGVGNESSMPAMERFLNSTGSGGGLVSVCRLLQENGRRSRGLDLYGRARPSYHRFTQAAIDSVLGLGSKVVVTSRLMPDKH